MLGTFSPQVEPYIHEMPEETTPSGMFARGTYSARTKVTFCLLEAFLLAIREIYINSIIRDLSFNSS